MSNEAKYSPVLWSALFIPIVSATELFVDPVTRSNYPFFVLASFYLVSVRYSLAVCLGVFAHDTALKSSGSVRSGAFLWLCYFLVLVLCSLLVPGAAIFGVTVTLILAFVVLVLSVIQGFLSLQFFADKAIRTDIGWRICLDVVIIACLIYEVSNGRFQSVFFALIALLFMDLAVNQFAKQTLKEMTSALVGYFKSSLRPTVQVGGGSP